MFLTVAVHHPRPEHVEDPLSFMKKIERGMEGTPGLISFESFRDVDETRLVAIGRWESAEAAASGVPRLLAIGGREETWSEGPDELFRLVAA